MWYGPPDAGAFLPQTNLELEMKTKFDPLGWLGGSYSDSMLIAYWEGRLDADESARIDEEVQMNPDLRKLLGIVIEAHLNKQERIDSLFEVVESDSVGQWILVDEDQEHSTPPEDAVNTAKKAAKKA